MFHNTHELLLNNKVQSLNNSYFQRIRTQFFEDKVRYETNNMSGIPVVITLRVLVILNNNERVIKNKDSRNSSIIIPKKGYKTVPRTQFGNTFVRI